MGLHSYLLLTFCAATLYAGVLIWFAPPLMRSWVVKTLLISVAFAVVLGFVRTDLIVRSLNYLLAAQEGNLRYLVVEISLAASNLGIALSPLAVPSVRKAVSRKTLGLTAVTLGLGMFIAGQLFVLLRNFSATLPQAIGDVPTVWLIASAMIEPLKVTALIGFAVGIVLMLWENKQTQFLAPIIGFFVLFLLTGRFTSVWMNVTGAAARMSPSDVIAWSRLDVYGAMAVTMVGLALMCSLSSEKKRS